VNAGPIWTGPDKNSDARLSPDGRFLAFTDPESQNLAIREIATGRNLIVTRFTEGTTVASHPVWSRNGQRLAYYLYNRADNTTALRVVGRDGIGDRLLHQRQGEFVMPWDWSPDDKQILIALRTASGAQQIGLIAIDDTLLRVVRALGAPFVFSMSISPSGSYVAYERPSGTGGRNSEIELVSVQDGREAPIIQQPGRNRLIGWMADGRHLLFTSSNEVGASSLWSIALKDGTPAARATRVVDARSGFEPLGVSQSGALLYRVNVTRRSVYTIGFDPLTGKAIGAPQLARVKEPDVITTGPDWSSDGRYLLYQRDNHSGGHGAVLTIVPTSDGQVRPENQVREIVPRMTDYSRTRWHPDGRSLVAHGVRDGKQGVYKIDVVTGASACLASSKDGELLNPSWASDGETLFYERSDRSVIAQTKDSAEREVFTVAPGHWLGTSAVSPDARMLAVIQTNRATRVQTLLVIPMAGGASRELLRVERPEQMQVEPGALAWTRDGRWLLFEKRSGPTYALWRVSVDGGEATPVGVTAPRDIYFLRIHPSGKRLAYVIGDVGENQWELWRGELQAAR
jgi:Tol biopolymer transport system component